MEQYVALCYSQHSRERSQHKAIRVLLILWICPKSYQLWTPRITSEGNENRTERKPKRKYLLKIHSSSISMGNLISHQLLKLLRMAVLIWVSSLDIGVQKWVEGSLSQDSKLWAKPWRTVRAWEFYLDKDTAWNPVLPKHRNCKDPPFCEQQRYLCVTAEHRGKPEEPKSD